MGSRLPLPVAGLVGIHASVGEDEAGHTLRGKVFPFAKATVDAVDEALQQGEAACRMLVSSLGFRRSMHSRMRSFRQGTESPPFKIRHRL